MADEPLILEYTDLSSRGQALTQALAESNETRERFLRDPAGVLAETSFPEVEVPAGELERSNRLLYRLLSNVEFMAWAEERQRTFQAELERAGEAEGAQGRERVVRDYLNKPELRRQTVEAIGRLIPAEVLRTEFGIDAVAAETPLEDFSLSRLAKPVNVTTASNFAVTVTVTVAAIFLVILAIDLTPLAPDPEEGLTRSDLQTVARFLTTDFAEAVRQERTE